MMKTTSKSRINLFIVFGLVIVILILSVLVLVLSYFCLKSYSSVKTSDSRFKYQQYQYNTLTLESEYGMVTLANQMEEEEFFSSRDDNGNYFLISNLGAPEYVCTGSCKCAGSEERKGLAASTVATRSLIYLLTAASSLIAINLAKEEFESDCLDQFSESECPSDLVFSEVDGCDEVGEKVGEDGEQKYICNGRCSVNHEQIWNDVDIEAAKGVCGNMEQTNEVSIFCSSTSSSYCEEEAKKKFVESYLSSFCGDEDLTVLQSKEKSKKDKSKAKNAPKKGIKERKKEKDQKKKNKKGGGPFKFNPLYDQDVQYCSGGSYSDVSCRNIGIGG